MDIRVTSNNGTIHAAEHRTKYKRYPGFVRKLCDGQGVPVRKRVDGVVTCRSKSCSRESETMLGVD